eukprot:11924219-Alexandrium_andersonii.AAC.1
MSASLVGSEMCIRDSASAVPGLRKSTGIHRLRRWSLCRSMCWAPFRVACLLYTSDAADDM